MSPITIIHEPPEAESVPAPRRRIGGSDIPKLMRISPYGGPEDVYRRTVLGEDSEWSPPMERGAMFEPVLRAYGQNALGIELDDTESDYHAHPTLSFAHAQIDDLARWHGVPCVVDYKTTNRFRKGWGAPDSDDVPEDIRAQVAWEMLCADRELALVVTGFGEDAEPPVYFSMSHVIPYQIQRDPIFESYLVALAKDFWEAYVLPRRAPPSTTVARKKRST